MKNKDTNLKKKVVGFLFLLISLLVIVSTMNSEAKIINDFSLIVNSHLSFWQILKLDFPIVSNPIGIFGAILSYLILKVLGRFFLMMFFLTGIYGSISCLLLKPNKKKIINNL